MTNEHGDIHWNELMTWDVTAAMAYYEKACGWSFTPMEMAGGALYHVAMKGDRPIAGLFPLSEPEFDGIPSHWGAYIAVDDVDAVAQAAPSAGAEVLRPPFDVDGVGRIAMIKDPTGAVIGMITPTTRA